MKKLIKLTALIVILMLSVTPQSFGQNREDLSEIDNYEEMEDELGIPRDIDEPDVDEPDIDEPDVDEPDIDEPDVDEPDIDEPDVDEPDIDEPDVDDPQKLLGIELNNTNLFNQPNYLRRFSDYSLFHLFS